jgi:hypothetical protein
MGPLDLFFHVAAFMAPALAIAALVAAAARILLPRHPDNGSWWANAAINLIVGLGVSAAGLWYFGVDGKMTTYAALVVAVASAQWASSRAWRG